MNFYVHHYIFTISRYVIYVYMVRVVLKTNIPGRTRVTSHFLVLQSKTKEAGSLTQRKTD